MNTKEAIEFHLWQAIDLMAATLIQPDPRIWDHLYVYKPKPPTPSRGADVEKTGEIKESQ